jgi:dTDP-4-amino-4,6-dideoxygalactose transaminase
MKRNVIPYLSFDGIHDVIAPELKEAAAKVIDGKWYILGKEVQNFEGLFSKYIDSEFGIGVNSGLDALIISLQCLGIGAGDEVIVASNAYIACWNSIYAVGADIVPVEPDPKTFNIDPQKIVAGISPKTKAIMVVHLFGQMCDMEKIMGIAAAHNLFVVEDNAQAQGAHINGRKSASWGHINATSFYPGKNLGAIGDAGMITTNNAAWAKKASALRNYGCHKKYMNSYIGLNSRLDEIQAAFLSVKLPHLKNWNEERLAIAKIYSHRLQGLEDLHLPIIPDDGSHVCHIYCIRTSRRDELQSFLEECLVQTLIHYPIPPHLQESFQHLGYNEGDFPIAEKLAKQSLSLPIYPGLREEDVEYITNCIKQFYTKISQKNA